MTMHPSRRSFITGAGAAALLTRAAPARAIVPERFHDLMRQLMAQTWVGKSWTKSDLFSGGEMVMRIGLSFDLKPDWSYTGAMVFKVDLEGTDYEGQFTTSGECWVIGSDVGVSIYRSQFIQGSTLPRQFGWTSITGDFRFYNDSTRKGHFTLQGVARADSDGTTSRVIMVDAD